MRQSTDDTVYCYYTKCPNTSCEHHAYHIHEFYVFRKYDYFKECQYWNLPETYYSCDSCEHDGKLWDEEPCDSCCGNHSGYVGVQIIHCHECKYGTHSGNGDRYICTVSPELRMEHEGDFFCGYAERREDERSD